MDQEYIPKTPHKYFQVETAPSGLSNYKNSALFTPAKDSMMETECRDSFMPNDQELEGRPA